MIVPPAILLTSFLIASYTDIRWTEVPDWLSYTTILSGLAYHLLTSIASGSANPLISSTLGLILYGSVGVGLFYLGQWGGGDAKLLAGAGAVIGFSTTITSPFILFPLAMLIAGGIYSIIWTAIVAARQWSAVKEQLKIFYSRRGLMRAQAGTAIAAAIVTIFTLFFAIPLPSKLALAILAFSIPLLLALFVTLRAIETRCFYKDIAPNELLEGDWIAHPLKVGETVIYTPTKTGITQSEMTVVQQSGIASVRIRTGIPFVPTFLIAYLLVLSAAYLPTFI